MKVGDLVCVVKPHPCCGNDKWLGRYYTVDAFGSQLTHCSSCGVSHGIKEYVRVGGDKAFFPYMLRVIPPLNELEAEKAVEHA